MQLVLKDTVNSGTLNTTTATMQRYNNNKSESVQKKVEERQDAASKALDEKKNTTEPFNEAHIAPDLKLTDEGRRHLANVLNKHRALGFL